MKCDHSYACMPRKTAPPSRVRNVYFTTLPRSFDFAAATAHAIVALLLMSTNVIVVKSAGENTSSSTLGQFSLPVLVNP